MYSCIVNASPVDNAEGTETARLVVRHAQDLLLANFRARTDGGQSGHAPPIRRARLNNDYDNESYDNENYDNENNDNDDDYVD